MVLGTTVSTFERTDVEGLISSEDGPLINPYIVGPFAESPD
jgi:hypothetical protein